MSGVWGYPPDINLYPLPSQACPELDEGKGDRQMVESVVKRPQRGAFQLLGGRAYVILAPTYTVIERRNRARGDYGRKCNNRTS